MHAASIGKRIAIVAVVVLVTAHLLTYFLSLFISPLGFDEAFILQAPLNLVQGLGYSTEDWLGGGANIAFDATVTTGPVIGMPVALSFLIFGPSIVAARIVTLPFFLLLLWCLVVLGRRYAGWWGAAAALGALLLLDGRADFPRSVLYGPSDALGEIAAASLLALGLVLLPKRRMVAGLAVGFAVLAKFIAAMAIPALVLALLLIPAVRGRRWGGRIGEAAAFVGFAAIPSVAWELVKLASLGPAQYLVSLRSYAVFVFHSGSGADGTNSADYLTRFGLLFEAWHLPLAVAVILGSAMVALTVFGAWGRRPSVDVAAVGVVLAGFLVWWVFVSSSEFVRHGMPLLMVVVPLLAALAVAGLRRVAAHGRVWRAATLTAGIVAAGVTAYGGVLAIVQSTQSPLWSRADQQATADFIASLGVDDVQALGWFAAPDVRFLSGVVSRPIGHGTGPLVIEPILRELSADTYAHARELCADVRFERNGFIVCDVRPGAVSGIGR
ncbi:MAG TPA: glycosyltransferase family 39 protein [Microbacteriaceae bacterium]|nr:glycosyltransferase family 39 protein [Microbacteriaceae bacterium]